MISGGKRVAMIFHGESATVMPSPTPTLTFTPTPNSYIDTVMASSFGVRIPAFTSHVFDHVVAEL